MGPGSQTVYAECAPCQLTSAIVGYACHGLLVDNQGRGSGSITSLWAEVEIVKRLRRYSRRRGFRWPHQLQATYGAFAGLKSFAVELMQKFIVK